MIVPRSISHFRREGGAANPTVVVFAAVAALSAAIFFAFTLPKMKERKVEQEAAAASAPEAVPVVPGSSAARPDAPRRLAGISDPARTIDALAEGLAAGKPGVFLDLLGPEVVTPQVMAKLETLLGPDGFQVDPAQAVSELARQATMQRWAVNLRHRQRAGESAAIEVDFARLETGSWKAAALRLPGDSTTRPGEMLADAGAMDVALGFIKAVMAQDFAAARKLVDASKINDATIAGMCILFEEGAFKLRQEKPLVATVAREDVAWFLAHVESPEMESDSRFGLVLQRDAGKPWLLTEINLDRLLAAYAGRFGDGDVYFTPLVRNPQGGDSIVLYFAYDSGDLHPRTRRQIEIVANVLKADTNRKLKISGHTDALGGEDYNQQLSKVRAEAVRAALQDFGVPADQVTIQGFGASRPRRENFNPDGTDNPEGRRVNRRAEIYLDF